MKIKGRIASISRDYTTSRYNIAIEMIEGNMAEIDALKDYDLSVELKKYHKSRSKDANALLWACLAEISGALGADKWDIYLKMLRRYGQFTYICVKPNMVEATKRQWRECEEIGKVNINGAEAVQLLCYFGSSTYNTKEFSRLLDGVISEMQEMGLETPTSGDMKRAIELWEEEHGQETS